eukprot:TRINITY_DN11930_c0_g1_i3.p1 TRINITY_DN11930_c0_g1~~TRINITY_DN11930_c0_g1_i3.p1  ORF type:complete len:1085 (+),score=221.84 TRINITY_DN11930_c0_g1_i3:40-3294(+)
MPSFHSLSMSVKDPVVGQKILANRKDNPWSYVGRRSGMQVWKVDNFRVHVWPPREHGIFYASHCYLGVSTSRLPDGSKQHQTFFWIGAEATEEEYKTACYFMLELNDRLDNPIQHREVMGYESRYFESLFPAFMVLDGDETNAFNPLKPKSFQSRLLQVKLTDGQKGGRIPVVRQVPKAIASLNIRDTFIYDGGDVILVWHGRNQVSRDKIKAQNVSQLLFDQRGAKPRREFIDQDIDDAREFFKLLGGKEKNIPDGEEVVRQRGEKVLYQAIGAPGDKSFFEVSNGAAVRRSGLESDGCFLLDDGIGLTVWVGRDSGVKPAEAFDVCLEFLRSKERPDQTPLIRLVEGSESQEFERLFPDGHVGGRFMKKGLDFKSSGGYKGDGRDGPLQLKNAKPKNPYNLPSSAKEAYDALNKVGESSKEYFEEGEQKGTPEIGEKFWDRPAPDGFQVKPLVPHDNTFVDLRPEGNASATPASEASKTTASAADVLPTASQEPVPQADEDTEATAQKPIASEDAAQQYNEGDTEVQDTDAQAVTNVSEDTSAVNQVQQEASTADASPTAQAPEVVYADEQPVYANGSSDIQTMNSFHGKIPRTVADELLQRYGGGAEGAFLLRNFMDRDDEFCISVLTDEDSEHVPCKLSSSGTIVVGSQDSECKTFADLIERLRSACDWFPVVLTNAVSKVSAASDGQQDVYEEIVASTRDIQSKHEAPNPKECEYFHPRGKASTAEKQIKAAGSADGVFMFSPFKDGQILLSVAFKSKVTHHLIAFDESTGTMTVNKKATPAQSLDEVIDFLGKKQAWWPVPLTSGIRRQAPSARASIYVAAEPKVAAAGPAQAIKATDEMVAAVEDAQSRSPEYRVQLVGPYFHECSIAEADEIMNAKAKADGDYLFLPYKKNYLMKLMFKKKITNHTVVKSEQNLFSVNGQKTDATTLPEVVEFLSKKPMWWPAAMGDGIPAIDMDPITSNKHYHGDLEAAKAEGKLTLAFEYHEHHSSSKLVRCIVEILGSEEEGSYLFAMCGGVLTLAVVSEGKPCLHSLQQGKDGMFKVNKKATKSNTLDGLVDFLNTMPKWWSCKLVKGIMAN